MENNTMNELNWTYMLDVLAGEKFTNIGLEKLAEIGCGEVIATKQHLLLTTRLYTPMSTERFAAI
jgi:hypothetical protein